MKKLIMCLMLGIFLVSSFASASYYTAPTGPNGRYTSDYPAYHRYYQYNPNNHYYPYTEHYYPTYNQRTNYYYYTPYYRNERKIEYEYYTKSKTDIKNQDGSRFSDYYEERIKVHIY